MSSSSAIICKICNRQKASYTCPKCQVPYCCLKCYQHPSHEKCSEKFYESNVLEELQQTNASNEEKQAMLNLLKQFEEDCAEDEETLRREQQAANLASRLSGIDLEADPQKIWEKLSDEERKEFTNLVKEQSFSGIVEEWLPWWTYKKPKKPLVTEVKANDTSEEQENLSAYNFPAISTKIQTFSNFCKTDPMPCIQYNAVNIVLAYTYIVMRYNGEHQDMSIQCSEDLVSISDVLLKADNCNSMSESIRKLCAAVKKLEDLFISLEHFAEVLDNLTLILHGPEEKHCNDYLLMAFSDLTILIDNARKELKKDDDGAEGRKQLLLIKRKLDYYSSWVLTHSETVVPLLISEVLVEKARLLSELVEHQRVDELTKKHKKSKDAEKAKIEVLE